MRLKVKLELASVVFASLVLLVVGWFTLRFSMTAYAPTRNIQNPTTLFEKSTSTLKATNPSIVIKSPKLPPRDFAHQRTPFISALIFVGTLTLFILILDAYIRKK